VLEHLEALYVLQAIVQFMCQGLFLFSMFLNIFILITQVDIIPTIITCTESSNYSPIIQSTDLKSISELFYGLEYLILCLSLFLFLLL